jgi:hypothetical protein
MDLNQFIKKSRVQNQKKTRNLMPKNRIAEPRNEKVSEPQDGVKILPKLRARSAPPIDERHDKFQFGRNPMAMTPFEKSRIALEIEERKMATEKYIKGIQGRDGGCYPDDETPEELYCPLNPSRSY